jgi:hypothetical protein
VPSPSLRTFFLHLTMRPYLTFCLPWLHGMLMRKCAFILNRHSCYLMRQPSPSARVFGTLQEPHALLSTLGICHTRKLLEEDGKRQRQLRKAKGTFRTATSLLKELDVQRQSAGHLISARTSFMLWETMSRLFGNLEPQTTTQRRWYEQRSIIAMSRILI